jgi:hypothetical protein
MPDSPVSVETDEVRITTSTLMTVPVVARRQ